MISPTEHLLSAASRCPDCSTAALRFSSTSVACPGCGAQFPVVSGIPVLIRSDNTVFPRSAYGKATRRARRGTLSDYFPWKSVNLSYRDQLSHLAREVAAFHPAYVLVIGSGDQRRSLGRIFQAYPDVVICYSDIDDTATVDVYCDAHDLPFQDGVFHGVIASAVLEHVLYPERVISEIRRVLKAGGLVYSEIPFMQQVHEGAYDFTRYTLSGHRRVFHEFEEISSGLVAGPGTSLLWALEHFLVSFTPGQLLSRLTKLGIRTLLFWVKYLDYLLRESPAAVDNASCTYFLGRKMPGKTISDREIIDGYRGRQRLRHV